MKRKNQQIVSNTNTIILSENEAKRTTKTESKEQRNKNRGQRKVKETSSVTFSRENMIPKIVKVVSNIMRR